MAIEVCLVKFDIPEKELAHRLRGVIFNAEVCKLLPYLARMDAEEVRRLRTNLYNRRKKKVNVGVGPR